MTEPTKTTWGGQTFGVCAKCPAEATRILGRKAYCFYHDLSPAESAAERREVLRRAELFPELVEALEAALVVMVAYDIKNKVISGLSLQLHEVIKKASGVLPRA